ncbi:MAG TPA: co-chaperone GroES [Patescibacteria group bacterium]|nr:co-chaperone GroES [Patescibacteria group bacterium]
MKKNINVRPLGENVLVSVEKEPTRTKSGLVLPQKNSKEHPQEGIIIAVGDSEKIKVKKGQKVIFAKYSGSEIKISEDDYLIIKNEDILAIVE